MPSQASREGALGISVGSSSGGNGVSVGVGKICVGIDSSVDVGSAVGVFSGSTGCAVGSTAISCDGAAGSSITGASVIAGAAAPQEEISIDRIRMNDTRRNILDSLSHPPRTAG